MVSKITSFFDMSFFTADFDKFQIKPRGRGWKCYSALVAYAKICHWGESFVSFTKNAKGTIIYGFGGMFPVKILENYTKYKDFFAF